MTTAAAHPNSMTPPEPCGSAARVVAGRFQGVADQMRADAEEAGRLEALFLRQLALFVERLIALLRGLASSGAMVVPASAFGASSGSRSVAGLASVVSSLDGWRARSGIGAVRGEATLPGWAERGDDCLDPGASAVIAETRADGAGTNAMWDETLGMGESWIDRPMLAECWPADANAPAALLKGLSFNAV